MGTLSRSEDFRPMYFWHIGCKAEPTLWAKRPFRGFDDTRNPEVLLKDSETPKKLAVNQFYYAYILYSDDGCEGNNLSVILETIVKLQVFIALEHLEVLSQWVSFLYFNTHLLKNG